MFWSSPSADINIIIILLIVSLGIAVASYIFSRRILVAVFVMSLLGNVILFGNFTHRIASAYDILWFFKFVRNVWPYINIGLGILLVASIIYSRRKLGARES